VSEEGAEPVGEGVIFFHVSENCAAHNDLAAGVSLAGFFFGSGFERVESNGKLVLARPEFNDAVIDRFWHGWIAQKKLRRENRIDIAIHAPDATSDERNHHAHIMVTMRTLGEDGFAAKKDRSLNSTEQLDAWREQWAHLANRHLERHGHEARIDHRSLEAQGIEREPTVHLGYAAIEMDKRGAQSDRMDALKELMARNEIRFEMRRIDRELIDLERAAGRQAEAPKQAERAAPDRTHHAAPRAPEAFRGREKSRAKAGAARAVEGVAPRLRGGGLGVLRGIGKVLDGLANLFEGLLGGGASAPPPTNHQQGQAAAPPAPEPPPFAGIAAAETERRRQTLEEYERDVLQRMKAMQELSRAVGREVISEQDFRMQEESDQKRSRDRGGGQSL